MTFPAPKIEGQVMPGSWVSAKRLALGCYPGDLYRQLSALEGVDLNQASAGSLLRVLQYLMEKEPSDLSVLLVRDQGALDFGAIDRDLERVFRSAGPEATLLLLSEPAPAASNFSINTWLAERGYLAWASSNPGSAEGKVLETADLNRQAALIDWSRTRAWCPPAGGNGIFVVRQDAKYPAGVPDEEYEGFRNRLIEEISSLDAVASVWKPEELYAGPFQELAPDLMLEWSGNSQGFVLAAGPAVKHGAVSRLPLSGIAPLLLYTLGLQVPDDMEGSVPTEVLDPGWAES